MQCACCFGRYFRLLCEQSSDLSVGTFVPQAHVMGLHQGLKNEKALASGGSSFGFPEVSVGRNEEPKVQVQALKLP